MIHAPKTQNAFCRIRVPLPGVAVAAYVRVAAELIGLPGEPAKFRVVSFTHSASESAVYTPHVGVAIVEILQRTHPAATLEPATFEDWVDSPPSSYFSTPSALELHNRGGSNRRA